MPHDDTNHPNLRSWVESANDPRTDFPIQNLPLCVVADEDDNFYIATRIGDQILNIEMLFEAGHFGKEPDDILYDLLDLALERQLWNPLAYDSGRSVFRLRRSLQQFLLESPAGGQQSRRLRANALVPASGVAFLLPCEPKNFTDFYASIHHATAVGSMFRPDAPLLPNYKHVPIGYHGRASSIVGSGDDIRRPKGQTKKDDAPGAPETPPTFGPCAMLDYELEVGMLFQGGNELGESVPIDRADEHIFGLCLVNDWSARDMQKWEYQPLGPFLAKNFATSIGDCIVTREALEPFRIPASQRPKGDPKPLEYLDCESNRDRGGFDITLEALLTSEKMREANIPPVSLSRSNAFREMYWTFAQMIAHHTSNGCDLGSADLLASGTISGPTPTERGCLLERTWQGRGGDGKPLPRKPLALPTGESRTFLEDGDEVIMRGWCEREGYRRIGLGECRGKILPAS